MSIISIFIIIVSIIIFVYTLLWQKKTKEKIEQEEEKFSELKSEYENLQSAFKNTYKDFENICEASKNQIAENEKLKSENSNLTNNINLKKENLSYIQSTITNTLDNQKKLSHDAFDNYYKVLDNEYKKTEEEYKILKEKLESSYSDLQSKLIAEAGQVQQDLDKIRATRAAAIQASLREKEIEENTFFYCINISDADKADIARLETLKPSLNKPRVLSMLIWQTWFQKPLKALAANLNAIDKTGIYKITNIKTKECYIGQAVDIGTRWAEHCKCGLGIDTPANNKLYKAMQDYSLWNFSFEVLEECPKEQLNEKEKYYIELYDSYNFGYNSNKGNSR